MHSIIYFQSMLLMHINREIFISRLRLPSISTINQLLSHRCKRYVRNGFEIGNANVTTPQSIQTASAQLVQIIANVSSSQYGGCTVDRVDELLSKYAQMNAQHHREVANDFVQPDKLRIMWIHK